MSVRNGVFFVPAAAVAVVMAIGGCQSKTGVMGRAIEGPTSMVLAVDGHDPRLKQDGAPPLADVEVSSRSEDGPSAGTSLGTTTSDKKGAFRLPVRDQKALIYPARFSASKPGYVPADQVMSVPPEGKQLLIILRPAGDAGGR
jgi:hypothetical protein